MSKEANTRSALPVKIGREQFGASKALIHSTLMRSVASPDSHMLDELIARSDLFTCTLESDPDVIIGFLLCDVDAKAVHYIFVKRDFRRYGIGRQLLSEVFGAHIPKLHTLNVRPREPWLFQRFKPKFQPLLLMRYACK